MLRSKLRSFLRLAMGIATVIPCGFAAGPTLDQQFTQTVKPFVTKYCYGCHSGETPAGQLDLKSYTTLDSAVHDNSRWAMVATRLTAKEMPPKPMPAPP